MYVGVECCALVRLRACVVVGFVFQELIFQLSIFMDVRYVTAALRYAHNKRQRQRFNRQERQYGGGGIGQPVGSGKGVDPGEQRQMHSSTLPNFSRASCTERVTAARPVPSYDAAIYSSGALPASLHT